jgi:hypothetical protein
MWEFPVHFLYIALTRLGGQGVPFPSAVFASSQKNTTMIVYYIIVIGVEKLTAIPMYNFSAYFIYV